MVRNTPRSGSPWRTADSLSTSAELAALGLLGPVLVFCLLRPVFIFLLGRLSVKKKNVPGPNGPAKGPKGPLTGGQMGWTRAFPGCGNAFGAEL